MKQFFTKRPLFSMFAILALLIGTEFAVNAASVTINGSVSQYKNQAMWAGIFRTSRDEGIVATPAGTQANSYQLTAGLNQVVTVATAGDGVRLQNTVGSYLGTNGQGGGIMVTIYNGGANALNVYPFNATDIINSQAAGAAFSIPAGKTATFFAVNDFRWGCNLSA